LRRAIWESGRTQRDIAAEAGISESRLSLIVNGLHADEGTRSRLSAVLGRNTIDLFPVDGPDDTEMAA